MAHGALADFDDANAWLDGTKLAFVDDTDAAPEADNADNLVRGFLKPLFGDPVDDWVHDGTGATLTPKLVKDIASMLMASYRYAKVYSEDVIPEADYAARLEARAMSLLNMLKTGELVLADTELVSGTLFEQDDFWPNDTTAVTEIEDDRKFTIGRIF